VSVRQPLCDESLHRQSGTTGDCMPDGLGDDDDDAVGDMQQ